ncbi:universal stress protein [Chloroflexota bacterium]
MNPEQANTPDLSVIIASSDGKRGLADMYQRILVPLDESDAAEVALPYAEELAVKLGAEVVMVSVSEPDVADTDRLSSYVEAVSTQVQRELGEWDIKSEAKLTNKVLEGKPATEILGYASKNNIDLIVMASRGRSNRGPWVLGSISAKVLRATRIPILLIRAAAASEAVQQKRLVKKIMVPLDGSDVGSMAIPHVENLARALDADIVLFHAIIEPVPVVVAPGVEFAYMPVMSKEDEGRRVASAMGYLSTMEQALTEKGLKASSEVSSGSPANEIIRYAEANSIDLIAMSTHGRSGISRWVFGSVTDKVLHAGVTPVFVVQAKKD